MASLLFPHQSIWTQNYLSENLSPGLREGASESYPKWKKLLIHPSLGALWHFFDLWFLLSLFLGSCSSCFCSHIPTPSYINTIDKSIDYNGLRWWLSGSSAFSKSSLNIWKFMVHVLLKPGLENFEHHFTSMWDECNYAVVWTFFGIAFLWDWNENWPFLSFFFLFVVNFVIHWNETAMGLHVFPIPIPPPTSLSTRSL